MISNISSAAATTVVQQSKKVQNVPSPSKGTSAKEDTVQLSNETQQHLTGTTVKAPQPQPTLSQIIKEAADGDISALAKLALIG